MIPNQSEAILSQFREDYNSGFEALSPKGHVTIHQKSLFSIWIAATLFWMYRLASKYLSWKKVITEAKKPMPKISSDETAVIDVVQHSENTALTEQRKDNIVTLNNALSSIFIFGCIMIYYFLCDYLHYFPKADRTYNRDLFVFLCIMLAAVAIFFTTTEIPDGKLLNRDQTEEWRGWMQVMFVWYHYFRAAETYNAIRIFIAAYVWMTGFGNFSFFWVRKDYSIRRMLKVLFRLNFLVVMTTMVVDNSYMLYYICAMHTFWYFTVYAMMRPLYRLNENRKVMYIKFILYFIVVTIIYEVPGLAKMIYSPFSIILNYEGSLHEWLFRSRLDHYMTLVGMLCAYYHPNVEKILKYINGHKLDKVITAAIASLLLSISYFWYQEVFILTKYDYNKMHPYTSIIPLLTFIYLRNSTVWLRKHYFLLFSFLGKITLETYISQLHIYLQTNAKSIIVYIPGYPLVNFIINTIIYLYMARLLFSATVTLNEYIFPADHKKMIWNIIFIVAITIVSYTANVTMKIF